MQVFMIEPKDNDLFYVGRQYEDFDGSKAVAWTLEGIYSNFELACKNADDGEFIIRIPINYKLPKEVGHPPMSWWKMDGEIYQSRVFVDLENKTTKE